MAAPLCCSAATLKASLQQCCRAHERRADTTAFGLESRATVAMTARRGPCANGCDAQQRRLDAHGGWSTHTRRKDRGTLCRLAATLGSHGGRAQHHHLGWWRVSCVPNARRKSTRLAWSVSVAPPLPPRASPDSVGACRVILAGLMNVEARPPCPRSPRPRALRQGNPAVSGRRNALANCWPEIQPAPQMTGQRH